MMGMLALTVRCAMMPPMRKVTRLMSVLAVLGLATTACAPADNTSSPPVAGGGPGAAVTMAAGVRISVPPPSRTDA